MLSAAVVAIVSLATAGRTGCRSCVRSWAAASTPSPLAPISQLGSDRHRLAATNQRMDAEVDILVNNAGLGIYTKFGAEGRDKELQMLRVDVEAVVDLMARYLPGMVERGRGAIINMSSVVGVPAWPVQRGLRRGESLRAVVVGGGARRSGRQRCHINGGLPWSGADGVSGHQRRRLPGRPATVLHSRPLSGWPPTPCRQPSVVAHRWSRADRSCGSRWSPPGSCRLPWPCQ